MLHFAAFHLGFHCLPLKNPFRGLPSYGLSWFLSQIVGVSILRAGETMEQALCEVYKDIRLGKILIQTNLDTGEPEVSSKNFRIIPELRKVSPEIVRFKLPGFTLVSGLSSNDSYPPLS